MTTSPEEAFRIRISQLPVWDDEPTIVSDPPSFGSAAETQPVVSPRLDPQPPALPMPLIRRRRDPEAWLADLPDPAREVLEAAREPLPTWPAAPRIRGAVARPVARRPRSVRSDPPS